MCPYEEKLTAWLLGDLSPEEQETVTRHLAACATCRAMRDELASVLAPLKGGLAKDQRLRVPAVQRPRHRVTAFLHAPWIRAAALFLVSVSTLFVLFGLFYSATTERKKTVGPVTTFTFHKPDQPPEQLEPLQPSTEVPDTVTMTLEPLVQLPLIVNVHVPEIPMREYDTLPFLAFAQFTLWASSTTNSPLIVYNDLLAQQLLSSSATNTTDNIPILRPPPHINAYPRIK